MSPFHPFTRHPAFAATSLATVTLVVAANLVVFSFANALWLKPGAMDADRVVVIGRDFNIPDGSRFSELGIESLRDTGALDAVAGQVVTSGDFLGMQRRVTLPDHGTSLETAFVTPDYFAVLGTEVRGREFLAQDGAAVDVAPAIISDRLWRTVLGARSDILGVQLEAAPVPLQIIGVAAAGFHGARLGERVDVWLPHRFAGSFTGQRPADWRFTVMPMLAFGRLRPGDSMETARATLAMTARGPREVAPLASVFGASDVPTVRIGGGDVIALTFGMAAFVLAGGCATLMALTLVHYERRHRELAIRAALGASRLRLATHVARELLGLAVAGTAGAVLLAGWALAALPAFSLPGGVDLSRLDLTLDWRVAVAGLAGCLLAVGVAGLVPVVRCTRTASNANLMSGTATAARASLRLRRAILGLHAAVTTVVLIAAALVVQSVAHARAAGPGFDADRVVFANAVARYRFFRDEDSALAARKARDVRTALDVVERIGSLPGVELVALGPPPLGAEAEERLRLGFRFDTDVGTLRESVALIWVGDRYFEALGVPILEGRVGRGLDAVVSPAFARRVWGDESALGRSLRSGSWSKTITGVAEVAIGSIRRGFPPAVFSFGEQTVDSAAGGSGELALVIRTAHADRAAGSIERLLTAAYPDGAVRVTTGRALVDADLGRERMHAWLFSGFGSVALVLALVSVFGLVAYVFESRWREFAVRMALGASRGSIAGRAVWSSLEPIAAGTIVGVLAAAALSGTIRAYLYGLDAVDPLSYAGVAVALIAGALIAAALAARRVLSVSVADSLRRE